jgi:hypothetical protein
MGKSRYQKHCKDRLIDQYHYCRNHTGMTKIMEATIRHVVSNSANKMRISNRAIAPVIYANDTKVVKYAKRRMDIFSQTKQKAQNAIPWKRVNNNVVVHNLQETSKCNQKVITPNNGKIPKYFVHGI